ncbi:MAG: restriction endonuclease subunit S [Planctomycetes bacterium]|nr:restriction endonuclease subunit S [Planctomycetota bacterium]
MNRNSSSVAISEVARVHSGAGFPVKYQGHVDQEIPFFRVSDMNLPGNEVEMVNSTNTISDHTRLTLRAILFPAGTVIFPKVGGAIATNKKRLLVRPSCVDNNVMGVIPDEGKIDRRLLYYFFLAHDLSEFANDAGLPSITKTTVENWGIGVVPPLPEQRRIVGILDEAFEGIARAKANAEKNLQNARALFESYLQSIFTRRGDGWTEKRLSEMARINYGYTESASSEKVGPRFLRITDIQDNRVDWETVPYCRIENVSLPKYKLADGDIVFARTGATTGKSYLVSAPPDAVFASYLIRVQLTGRQISPQFLNLFFQTQSYWDEIRAGVSGSAQGGFNATKLGELEIPFPTSPKEQQRVVAQLNAFAAETQRLARVYEQELAVLDGLKKSLLHQAFSGNL